MPRRRRYFKGKKVSKGELKIATFLKENSIIFEMQKSFPDCKGKKRPLRFDFYLTDKRILIEYDGEHHYKPVNKGRRAKYVHQKTKVHDEIKNTYIKKEGIGLLRIPYWEYDKIEEILNWILKS